MLGSKPLRKFIRTIKSDFGTFGFKDFCFYTFVYPFTDTFSRYKERIGRTLSYARLAWLHYDFDSAYLWDIMAFKLKRIEEALKNGNAVQEDADMKAIRESIEICERLFGERYEEKYSDEHNKKWGDMPPWGTEPADTDSKGNILTYRILFKDRPNVTNDTEREQERVDFRSVYQKAEADRLADMDRLFFLLKNHSKAWWD